MIILVNFPGKKKGFGLSSYLFFGKAMLNNYQY